MFYIAHFLTTKLKFSHCQLKDLTSREFIRQRLKSTIQGRCLEDYGYLIQILPMKGYQKERGIHVIAIQIVAEGFLTKIQFDCICFKPLKNDIFDIWVDSITSDMIRGKLGPAEVMIPKQRMTDLKYCQSQGTFIIEEQNGGIYAITVGSILRCKCIEWVAQSDTFMKIIAEVDRTTFFSSNKENIE